ncbi:MAG: four helix bundle protein [Acidobacteria bacterium]|nr:four helix bundle protein [Acidobacteriota bacterium]
MRDSPGPEKQKGTGSGLSDRTREFALRIVRLYSALPRRRQTRVMGDQLLRSGTSVGAHFREALRARSKSEYVAKLNSGLMELEESLYWMELLLGSGAFGPRRLAPLMREAESLISIFVSIIKRHRPREARQKAEGRRQK